MCCEISLVVLGLLTLKITLVQTNFFAIFILVKVSVRAEKFEQSGIPLGPMKSNFSLHCWVLNSFPLITINFSNIFKSKPSCGLLMDRFDLAECYSLPQLTTILSAWPPSIVCFNCYSIWTCVQFRFGAESLIIRPCSRKSEKRVTSKRRLQLG